MDDAQEPKDELKQDTVAGGAADGNGSATVPPAEGAPPAAPVGSDDPDSDVGPAVTPVTPAADTTEDGLVVPSAAPPASGGAADDVPPVAPPPPAGAPAAGPVAAPPAAAVSPVGGSAPAAAAGGGGNGDGPQSVNLNTATPSQVADTAVVASEVKPPAGMTIGKKLTLWMLSILAGSILVLMLYLWGMEQTAGDDIRRNYGKDLNRDNISLYMGQRIQRFSNDLAKAQTDPTFAAPKNNVTEDKALSETLGSLPDVTEEQRSQLMTCVSLIANKAATGADRKAALQPCIDLLEKTKSDGMTAATAVMSFQMASEASAKLLEERQNLHEFWLKAAQLILLNLLLPVLTAVIGYTFGNNQANQSQGSSQQGSSQ